MSYREFRADFAKTFFVEMVRRLPVYSNREMPGTTKIGDEAQCEGIRKAIAKAAVRNADNLIAELERTDRGEQAIAPAPAPTPPAPTLPRLNTGWKWAKKDKHVFTKFDYWFTGQLEKSELVGNVLRITIPLATPDWHNPEGIVEAGDGWRFFVRGEERQVGDMFHDRGKWHSCILGLRKEDAATYRTPDTRPLPPVMADEKEVAP